MTAFDPLLVTLCAAGAGLIVGFIASGLLRGQGSDTSGHRDADHRLRSLDAELRVAQRNLGDMRAARESEADELKTLRAQVAAFEEQAELRRERMQQLQQELRQECRKTDELRRELSDRAEEMARTHVQLRDAENELDVAMVGSDVVADQITRLEREREELRSQIEALKHELEAAL